MLKNYIRTALRSLKKQKTYTAINILCLALGMGCSIVLYLVLNFEQGYNQHHSQYDRIYRVNTVTHPASGINREHGTPFTLARAIRAEVPEVAQAGQINLRDDVNVAVTDQLGQVKRFKKSRVAFIETQLLHILDVQWLAGNPQTALMQPNGIVLTNAMAQQLFGNEAGTNELLGQTLTIDNEHQFMVTGIVAVPPVQTDIPYTCLMPYQALEMHQSFYNETWNVVLSETETYVLLNAPATEQQLVTLNGKLSALVAKYGQRKTDEKMEFELQPMADIHFNATYGNLRGRVMDRGNLTGMAIIGLLLIVTACINFVNLATAQSVRRAKEVGIRKVLGSSRKLLIVQFLSEALLITLAATIVALSFAELFLINFNDYVNLPENWSVLSEPTLGLFVGVTVVLVTLLAGLYPAFVLSGYQPLHTLKAGMVQSNAKGLFLRRSLVVVQFGISQALIIGTLVVVYQMRLFNHTNLGFEQEAVVIVSVNPDAPEKLTTLHNLLTQNAAIAGVSYSIGSPIADNKIETGFTHVGIDNAPRYSTDFKAIDHRYIETFGLELLAGRNFPASDSSREVIVNETLLQLIGFTNPQEVLNEKIHVAGKERRIVGVVKDFHNVNLKSAIEPCVFMYIEDYFVEAGIKVKPVKASSSGLQDVLAFIENTWEQLYPEGVFSYRFLDERIAQEYGAELKMARLFGIFTAMAIIIGCLGLFGIVSFLVTQKTKEVGIRKVLGASMGQIVYLFSKEFIRLILIAFVLAAPPAVYLMQQWLQAFAYRIQLGPGIIGLAILASLVIAAVTVGYRSVKAANANPIESLRNE